MAEVVVPGRSGGFILGRGGAFAKRPPDHLKDRTSSTADHSKSISQADVAKQIFDMRRARDDLFPQDVFAEPAWDILLFLYWAEARQKRITVSAVCASAGVPVSTALRWIQRMLIMGMLEKEAHPTDSRVSWITLSEDAQCKLDRFFKRLNEDNSS